MAEKLRHSPSPWLWSEFGVLTDAEGEAILDQEDWNITPENSVLIAAAPELLSWVEKVVRVNGYALPKELIEEAKALALRATDSAIRK